MHVGRKACHLSKMCIRTGSRLPKQECQEFCRGLSFSAKTGLNCHEIAATKTYIAFPFMVATSFKLIMLISSNVIMFPASPYGVYFMVREKVFFF